MVQNLNNNLITAPELSELRKRLRNLETRVRIRHECSVRNQTNHYRTVKLFSLHCSDLGVTTQSQPFLFASLRRLMNRLTTFCRYCKYSVWSQDTLLSSHVQRRAGNDRKHAHPDRQARPTLGITSVYM